jgi:hypothetical protein
VDVVKLVFHSIGVHVFLCQYDCVVEISALLLFAYLSKLVSYSTIILLTVGNPQESFEEERADQGDLRKDESQGCHGYRKLDS